MSTTTKLLLVAAAWAVAGLAVANTSMAAKGGGTRTPTLAYEQAASTATQATYTFTLPGNKTNSYKLMILRVECFDAGGTRVTVPWPPTTWVSGTQWLHQGTQTITSPVAGDHCRAWVYDAYAPDDIYPPTKRTSSNVVEFAVGVFV
jgi:hypothetical protein